METILQALAEILEKGRSLIKTLEGQQKTLTAKAELLDSGVSDLKLKLDNFSERESKVVQIENLRAFKAEAQSIMDKAVELKAKLQKEREDFENYKQLETNRISDLRLLQKKEQNGIDEARKYIEEEVDRRVNEFVKHIKK